MKYAVLASGSKGNATLIQMGDTNFIIDVGISFSTLKVHLANFNLTVDDIDYFLITHEHSDHIKGLKQINKSRIIVPEGLHGYVHYLKPSMSYVFNDIKINTVALAHDSQVGLGFVFTYNNQKLGYFTDSGYFPEDYLDVFSNCHYYIFESNHDEKMLLDCNRPYFVKKRILSDDGHLSNTDSAYALANLIGENTKEITLAHLSQDANDEILAINTHLEIYKELNINYEGFSLRCAKQDRVLIGGRTREY